jgi:hypothetical protein
VLPELERIDDIIAEDVWSYERDGTFKTSRVTIGRPMPWSDNEHGDWVCRVDIEGFTEEVQAVAGVGPVDALMNAITLVKAFADDIGPFTPRVEPLPSGYKARGAKLRTDLVKDGTEVRVSANREGMRYLADICRDLAAEEYDAHRPPHKHVEPALNTAEPGSVPIEFFLADRS